MTDEHYEEAGIPQWGRNHFEVEFAISQKYYEVEFDFISFLFLFIMSHDGKMKVNIYFCRFQNVLGWSKFFVPDQKFIDIL